MTLGLSGKFTVEWEPHLPHDILPFELALYRKGRNELCHRAATELGVRAIVVELPGADEIAAKNKAKLNLLNPY
jgi:hypothetical protein